MTSFVDSGGWISVAIAWISIIAPGGPIYEALPGVGATLMTTDFVLDEVITRLRYDAGHRAALAFLDFIRQAEATGKPAIHRIDEDLWMRAEAIFRRFDGPDLSFTDCTSFALLREHPVDEVFGFDSHFEMMGFLLQPKPRGA